jgi:hypothetical protein
LFAVFGRPDIGLIVDAVILLPIVAVAWFDYALLARRARRYLEERCQYLHEKERGISAATQEDPAPEHA